MDPEAFILPVTSNFSVGLALLIPIFPFDEMRRLSLELLLLEKNLKSLLTPLLDDA